MPGEQLGRFGVLAQQGNARGVRLGGSLQIREFSAQFGRMFEQNPAESDDDGRQILGVVALERVLWCFEGQGIELGSQHAEDSPKANLGRMTTLSLELQRALERGLFPWCVDLHGLRCLHLFELQLQGSESPRQVLAFDLPLEQDLFELTAPGHGSNERGVGVGQLTALTLDLESGGLDLCARLIEQACSGDEALAGLIALGGNLSERTRCGHLAAGALVGVAGYRGVAGLIGGVSPTTLSGRSAQCASTTAPLAQYCRAAPRQFSGDDGGFG